MTHRILRRDAAGVCTLTLNRPDKCNALDTAAFEALDAELALLERDDNQIGCVVLTGAQENFCAGADLSGVLAEPDKRTPPTYKPRIVERLAQLPQPVVAAVSGVCFTGGLELALACDFVVADHSARFADTHGKWGLVGAWGLGQRLPRRIGVPAAKRMMLTSREVHAVEAKALGLVDVLAEQGRFQATVDAFVGEILTNSWFTNRAVKRMFIETDGMSLAAGLAHEHYRYPGLAPDHRQRIEAFRSR